MKTPFNQTPRRIVDPTVIAAPATVVALSDTSPLLSGEDLTFVSSEGTIYTLHTSRLIGAGGQGSVVEANDEAGKCYAAKLSYQPHSAKDRRARQSILTYLHSLMDEHPLKHRHFTQTHLMPIYAFGVIHDTVADLGETTYDVTIMPLCDDRLSHQTDVTYHDICTTILPQAAEALHLLHEQRIVHRDVKPKNLYYLEDQIVLGDFGISSILDEGRDTGATHIDRRTPGYSPHSSTVQCENDWYALGYTLWTLYNHGQHPHQLLIDQDDLSPVLAGKRPVPFIPQQPDHASLGDLIYGLTYAHSQGRLGYDDIQRWLKNPQVFSYHDPLTARAIARGYQFEGNTYDDLPSLAQALLGQWERAKRHLYTHALEEHFRVVGLSDMAVALNDITDQDDVSATDQDIGLSRALALMANDTAHLYWKGTTYAFAELGHYLDSDRSKKGSTCPEEGSACPKERLAYPEEHSTHPEERTTILDLLLSGTFSWTLSHLASASTSVLQVAQSLEEDARRYPDFALAYIHHALRTDGAIPAWNECTSPDECFALLGSNPLLLYRTVRTNRTFHDLLGTLAAMGYLEQTRMLEEWMATESASESLSELDQHKEILSYGDNALGYRVNRFLSLMGQICADQASLRSFATTWGPLGFAPWMQSHLTLYRARDKQGTKLLEALKRCSLDASLPFTELHHDLTRATDCARALLEGMEQSPYIHEAGIVSDSDHITPTSANAYPTSCFCGEVVPQGFVVDLLAASQKLSSDCASPLFDTSETASEASALNSITSEASILSSQCLGCRNEQLREEAHTLITQWSQTLEDRAKQQAPRTTINGYSIPVFIALFAGALITLIGAAALWAPCTLELYSATVFDESAPFWWATSFPTATFTALAFVGFFLATCTIITGKVQALIQHSTAQVRSDSIHRDAMRLSTLAQALEDNTSAAARYVGQSEDTNVAMAIDTHTLYGTPHTKIALPADTTFLQVLFWLGAGLCSIGMLLASINGISYACLDLPRDYISFPYDASFVQYLYVVLACIAFGVVAGVRRKSRTMVTLALLCIAPVLPYLALMALVIALIVGAVLLVLYIIFGR